MNDQNDKMNMNPNTANEAEFHDKFMPKMNRIGKITGYLGVLLSFAPAVILAIVYKLLPDPAALLTAFISIASAVGVLWFVEPISYFPIVGPIGTYMAFLSGNISNMRIPCASMAQMSSDTKPGTPQGTVAGVIGMAVSIVINVSVLTIGVIMGSSILSALPENVRTALNYLLPALFGALLVQFGLSQKRRSAIVLVFAILLCAAIRGGLFNWLPGASNYLAILATVFFSIFLAIQDNKKTKKQRG